MSAKLLCSLLTVHRQMSETKPISFRVDADVLKALEAAGKSPVEISRAALEREARLARVSAALDRLRKAPTKLKLPKDAVAMVRENRDAR